MKPLSLIWEITQQIVYIKRAIWVIPSNLRSRTISQKGMKFLSGVRERADSNELIGNSNGAGPAHPVINNITCTWLPEAAR